MARLREGLGRQSGQVLVCASVLVALAACGSGSSSGTAAAGSGGACSLPAEVKVAAIQELTGPAAFAGLSAQKGVQLAVKEINANGLLGSSKLTVDYTDTAGKAETSASQMTSDVANKDYLAAFGPVSSGTAVASAPIANKGKLPVVYSQAGSEGVVIGDYTFRITPPMASYYPKISDYIKTKNVKRLSVIYTSDFPTLNGIATKTLPTLATQDGFSIVSSTGAPLATQDFSAPITKALDAKPDMVAILLVGAQNPTAMKQLRQAGFNGPVIGNSGAGAGNLKPAGAAGAGMTWPATFDASTTSESGKKFVAAYQAAYNEAPLNYAAESYDGAYWMANAIKAGCGTREGTMKALKSIAAKGFTGALGQITFEGNDARLPGIVVQWDGEKQIVLSQ